MWRALPRRDRGLALVAVGAVAALLVWLVLVQPAWRTIREAPARLDQLEAQMQQVQRLAAETRELRGAAPVAPSQAAAALKAATDRLGDKAKLALQGDRATLTLTGVAPEPLAAWLGEARSAARARPVEAQLTRNGQALSGSVVLTLGGVQ